MATILRIDGSRIAIRVANLSSIGCCIESDERFEIGEWVHLSLPQASNILSQIRWIVNGRAGIRFEVPIDLALRGNEGLATSRSVALTEPKEAVL